MNWNQRVLLGAGVVLAAVGVNATPLPNVVVIYGDDMGFGDLGANNPNSKIPTPNLDELAARGMRFTDGHSSSGICTPSRFALLTGQHHWRRFHGIVNAFGPSVFEPEDFTLPKMFKSKGYKTAAIGKWHLGWDWESIKVPNAPTQMTMHNNKKTKAFTAEAFDWSKPIPNGPLAQGFDYYYGDGTINFPPFAFVENDRLVEAPTMMVDTERFEAIPEGSWEFRPGPMAADWNPYEVLPKLTDKAVEWIGNQQADQPFFLYFAWPSPHAPIVPNKAFRGTSEAGPYGDYVCESDAMAGRILAALNAGGFADNTIVIFTADNGPENYAYDRLKKYGHWSPGPSRGVKRDMWEGGHRVPFIISWPGKIAAGAVSDETISQVDLAATFAQVIGYDLRPQEAIDSYDLTPLMKGEKYSQPLRTATVQNTAKGKYSLRQGDWMYIDTQCGGLRGWAPDWFLKMRGYKKESTSGLLFNLKDDPGEHTNLYEQYPEKVAQMKQLLKRYVDGEPCAPHAK